VLLAYYTSIISYPVSTSNRGGGVPLTLSYLPYVPLTDFPNHLGQDIDVLKNQRIIGQKNTPRITKECN
jgi:hypothetical protein